MKWSAKQIRVMKRTVKAWEAVVAGEDRSDCPCCEAFAFEAEAACVKCPIAIVTGKRSCTGTNYLNYITGRKPATAVLADMYYVESVITEDDWIRRGEG